MLPSIKKYFQRINKDPFVPGFKMTDEGAHVNRVQFYMMMGLLLIMVITIGFGSIVLSQVL